MVPRAFLFDPTATKTTFVGSQKPRSHPGLDSVSRHQKLTGGPQSVHQLLVNRECQELSPPQKKATLVRELFLDVWLVRKCCFLRFGCKEALFF